MATKKPKSGASNPNGGRGNRIGVPAAGYKKGQKKQPSVRQLKSKKG